MGRLTTSFILGYHGCEKAVLEAVVAGKADLNASKRDYDWLGKGVYFWESDPKRAREWAEWKVSRGDYKDPTVIGAVIDLGNCLDLTTRNDLELVKSSYEEYCSEQQLANLPIAANENARDDPNEDRLLRYLDCAVINHLHYMIGKWETGPILDPFDTVRGMFTEGGDLYVWCWLQEKNT